MARYTFALGTIFDPAQAIEEPADDEAARVHAGIVAEELNRNRYQPLVLLILNENGQIIYRVPPVAEPVGLRQRSLGVGLGQSAGIAAHASAPRASVIVPSDLRNRASSGSGAPLGASRARPASAGRAMRRIAAGLFRAPGLTI